MLKFKRDRERWLYWLFEAKKRYGLTVLDYIVTSNHIHLLVEDGDNRELAKSMQLIAGRTAQEYNTRKKREGALWSDRYHATAVDTDHYLIRCLVYIDLNMVRAGVVNHPLQWPQSGFNEIQHPPERYRIIDRDRLCELVGIKDVANLSNEHNLWIEAALSANRDSVEKYWSQSVAVGSHEFAKGYIEGLGVQGYSRKMKLSGDCFIVKEDNVAYSADL